MSNESSGALAGTLVALSLVLPACGGDEAAAPQPASEAAPAEDMRVLERRVGGLERQLRELREAIESRGSVAQSSGDEAGDEAASDAAPDASGPASSDPAGAGAGAGAGASGAAGAASGAAGGGSTGSGGGSGPGSGGGSGGGPGSGGGGSRSGAGGSGSGGSQDPTIEDICGPNPAPEC